MRWALRLLCLCGASGLAGCSTGCPVGAPCERACARDEVSICGLDEECICAPILDEGSLNIDTISGAGGGAGAGGASATEPGEPRCAAPTPGALRIAEVLIDAPSPEAEHEFVELVNLMEEPIALEGVQLMAKRGGALKPRVTFTGGCMPASGAVAVYADRGRWIWDPAPGPGLTAETSAFGFNNEADFHFELRAADGRTLDRLEGPGALIPEEASVVRHPDPRSDVLAHHGEADSRGRATSPARCLGGGRYVDGCSAPDGSYEGEEAPEVPDAGSGEGDADPAPEVEEGEICPAPRGQELAINEILIDGETPDDEHEYIELVNLTEHPISLDGVKVTGNRGASRIERLVFQRGCLPGQSGITIFKGRMIVPEGVPAPQLSVRRFGIHNDAPFDLQLISPDGEIIARAAGPGDVDQEGVSMMWSPEGYVSHLQATMGALRQSPGLCVSGKPFSEGCR